MTLPSLSPNADRDRLRLAPRQFLTSFPTLEQPRFGVLGKALSVAEVANRQARQLLARYGVVTRGSLDDESGSWEWPLIYAHLQQMEMRGEVRRGYFVQGAEGVQFALPEVVETLRKLRDGADAEALPVVLNACDPANLYGPARNVGAVAADDARQEALAFARVPTTWVVQHRGLPVLVASNGGSALTVTPGLDESILRPALQALLDHLTASEPRVLVETLNGGPILESSQLSLLESIGFYRYYPWLAWERRR